MKHGAWNSENYYKHKQLSSSDNTAFCDREQEDASGMCSSDQWLERFSKLLGKKVFMMPEPQFLTVARFEPRTRALGPGCRAVIWFHGCSFNCPGCIAAEMNVSKEFARVQVNRLVRTVTALPDIEGITLSGGDPFDQDINSLAFFLEELRARSSLSVMCYTGRTLAQLRQGSKAAAHECVLANVDVLVDGLYVEALNDGSAWRGSSNQQVHFLTPRYRHLEEGISRSRDRQLEVALDGSARLHITGIPPSGFLTRLGRELHSRGLSMITQPNEEVR